MKKKAVLSKRVLKIIDTYKPGENPVVAAHKLLKDILNPVPERYDMMYRYEHTLRVTQIGMAIANAEGLPDEPIILACLLHDVGYPECKTFSDLWKHPELSAKIAELFFQNIGYDEKWSKTICRGIAMHSLKEELPKDMTPFEITVRDADDIDRFSLLRSDELMGDIVKEHSTGEILERCEAVLRQTEGVWNYPRGTKTAREMWEECLQQRKNAAKRLIEQLEISDELKQLLGIER